MPKCQSKFDESGAAGAVPTFDEPAQYQATKTGRNSAIRLARPIRTAILLAGVISAIVTMPAAVNAQANVLTQKTVEAIALQWFDQMRTGKIDRTQLAADYNAQLTDDAVKNMSAYLNEYKYGASPTGAQILRTRAIGEQTFYDVKLTFPRGDAASLLIGFNAEAKITGIDIMSMAGD